MLLLEALNKRQVSAVSILIRHENRMLLPALSRRITLGRFDTNARTSKYMISELCGPPLIPPACKTGSTTRTACIIYYHLTSAQLLALISYTSLCICMLESMQMFMRISFCFLFLSFLRDVLLSILVHECCINIMRRTALDIVDLNHMDIVGNPQLVNDPPNV